MVNWREEAIRSAILFGMSVILVAGFWFHGEFYSLGFYPLLVAGGFVTFLVIATMRYAVRGRFYRGRPRVSLPFAMEDGERLLQRRASLAILPVDAAMPPVGGIAVAKFETGTSFAHYRVVDAYRKILGDVNAEESRQAGFRSPAELREEMEARGAWQPERLVLLARLEPIGGSAQ